MIEDTTDPAITAMTKRLDMVTSVTRLLLDNSTFSEAVTLQRCARLLAGELADWVIIDIDRGGQLRRQFAAGSRDGQADQRVPAGAERAVRSVDPDPESAPWQVHSTGKSVLLAHPDDPSVLGTGPGGTPLLMTLGATSLICVPISDGSTGYGALTLARQAANGPFSVADLGLAEDLGQHLANAIRVDRMFRRRSEVAESLQASLLPASLPTVPWLEFAAAYIGATQWQEISGDFYDVFPASDGWAIAVGDVCGKGQDAAAMTAAARHSIRALAHVHDTPEDVLTAANQVLLAGDYGERFVTASLAFLRQHGRRVQVRLGGCGHPGPAVVRADGRVEILEADGMPLGLFDDLRGEQDGTGAPRGRPAVLLHRRGDRGAQRGPRVLRGPAGGRAGLGRRGLGGGDRARGPGAGDLVLRWRAARRRDDARGQGGVLTREHRSGGVSGLTSPDGPVTAARRGPRSPRCRRRPGAGSRTVRR